MKNIVGEQKQEVDLGELFDVLWKGKLSISIITIIFAVSSIFYALSIPNQYKSEEILMPSELENNGISGTISQLGGLASLAGVDIAGENKSEAKIAVEVMQSWSFVEKFIADNRLEVNLIAVQGWDRETDELIVDESIYDRGSKKWIGVEPTSWDLFQSFLSRVNVERDKTTGLVAVSMEYYSPEMAKSMLDQYIDAINRFMQNRQMVKVSRNIEYLQQQISKTSIAEMQEVFYNIIGEQIKNKMLAEASPEYVFVSISPSMLPEKKSQPQRARICISGTLIGAFLSLFWVLGIHYYRKYSN